MTLSVSLSLKKGLSAEKPFFVDGSLGRKQEIMDSLGGSQI